MSETPTQKLINDGAAAVDEMLEGVLAAHGDKLFRPDHAPRAIVARHGPRPGKVALVIGGGSGHEPTFLGFVGKGLADAAAIGNVFASPPPQPAVDAALAANGGAGVLFMYGNYAGDVMNFDMASELARAGRHRGAHGADDRRHRVRAARSEREKRRGVAGNVFIFKAAGAAADRMLPLDEVERIARHANARTYTLGVALGALLAAGDAPRTISRSRPARWKSAWASMASPGCGARRSRPADAVVDEIMDAIFREMQAIARRPRRCAGQLARRDAADGALHPAPPRRAAHRGSRPDAALLAGRPLLHVAGNGGRLDHADASRRRIAVADRPPLRLRDVLRSPRDEREITAAGFHAESLAARRGDARREARRTLPARRR